MNPVILKVGLISFFADLSSELLYPITPLFITGVLHASMTSLGAIEGCAELTASLLKGWAGKKSDQLGSRRTFVWGGYLISTLSKASIGIASTWVGVLVARSLDRVGKGVRTAPRDALIAESVPKEQLGFAFGVHRGMDTLGAVLGPLLALLLLGVYGEGNLRSFYFYALIPGVCAVILATRLPETLKKKASERAADQVSDGVEPFPGEAYSTSANVFRIHAGVGDFFVFQFKRCVSDPENPESRNDAHSHGTHVLLVQFGVCGLEPISRKACRPFWKAADFENFAPCVRSGVFRIRPGGEPVDFISRLWPFHGDVGGGWKGPGCGLCAGGPAERAWSHGSGIFWACDRDFGAWGKPDSGASLGSAGRKRPIFLWRGGGPVLADCVSCAAVIDFFGSLRASLGWAISSAG
ncbi:MFS transporter [bacterium]|nr:MFS transporter [bacterium]